MAADEANTLWAGRFLAIDEAEGWEYCTRRNATAVVTVVAVTSEGRLLLTEQYRPPLRARVIELPAGLVGDEPGQRDEPLTRAAARELEEETGYRAARLTPLTAGPSSAGLSDELIHFFAAEGLSRAGAGGGVDGERIEVHEIAVNEAVSWLDGRRATGALVDFKIYAGLYLLGFQRG